MLVILEIIMNLLVGHGTNALIGYVIIHILSLAYGS
jgi:hypothetical protein